MSNTTTAAARWGELLAAWAIPPGILAAVARSPWGHPVRRFADRADAAVAAPSGASFDRARQALLHEGGGTVLDVGAGAGAASLPLAPWASSLTAVDRSDEMLAALAERAAELALPVALVQGSWPDVADEVGAHDLVVCHHVVYDVPDIGPFLAALTARARRRVVLELPVVHPLSWMAPLWLRFHDLPRPTRPTVDDLVAVLHEQGLPSVVVDRWTRREQEDGRDLAERAALATRRLCLPESREAEVAAAMSEVDRSGRMQVATVSWAGDTAP